MADYSPILRDDSVKARFWAKVDKRGPDECWEWQAGKGRGYGKFTMGRFEAQAHRASLILSGQVPKDGDVTDHMCCNKACVNPRHLRFVTQKINVHENNPGPVAKNAAKTHCLRGHELFGDNLTRYTTRKGYVMRICRTCQRARIKAYKRALRVKALALRELAQREALQPSYREAA